MAAWKRCGQEPQLAVPQLAVPQLAAAAAAWQCVQHVEAPAAAAAVAPEVLVEIETLSRELELVWGLRQARK